MNITLTSYQPFDYTKALANYTQTNWNRTNVNWIDICRKVGTIALAIISFLPVFFIDLFLLPVAFACRNCDPTRSPNSAPVPPQAPNVRKGKIPSPELLRQMTAHPYPNFPYQLTNHEFFRDSIRSALALLEQPKQEAYKQYISEDDAEQVNIYLWSAGSLLIHYLRSKNQSDQVDQLFPRTFPELLVPIQGQAEEARRLKIQNNDNEIEILWREYQALSQEEKACASLQIMVPEVQWQLTKNADLFVKNVHAKALDITQNNDFNVQIYRPLVNAIENI